ncbi:MAG: ribosomal-protein-serine acetyltransferase, partial [Gammaproteobacteria bacterium]|nr:ribosomal-protein-serine acetyltransferase [Gammaproteobacteria bacterium]
MITLQKNKFGQTVGQEIKNWRARKMPPKITMQGKFCILEPIDIDKHAAKLFEMLSVANKGASWTYLSAGPFNDCEEFKKWLLKTATESDTIFYAIIDPKSLHPIGIA